MSSEATPRYTVLARRFRPQSFAEVVGQEHVGQSIQNAIRSGRVAHAYLFTGARGVGKTSTARIFAKALNCPNSVDGTPCNDCDVCRQIGAGSDVDVLEIDGASNRGIDDIRQLRANVNVRSMRSPYKVYIIDEVHMLTKEAFNALLKTLEEPPPNVKFVFCTTEPNKLPDTILSRCQRFDFGTIAQQSIATRLTQIAQAEGKEVSPEAVELVARRAAGSMRDSQSLFDQLLAFGGDSITADDVHQLLGTASDERLLNLVDAMISQQPAAALELIEQALQEGVQIGSLSDQLLACFRDLLVVAAQATEVPLSAVAESSRPRMTEQALTWGIQTITAALQILADTKARMQRASYGRALLELALVRISTLENLDQIATLIESVTSGSPAAARTAPARPAPAALKKNSPPVPVAPKPPVTESFSQTRKYQELSEPNKEQFWQELVAESSEQLASHLKNSSRVAISGPNRLDILFPTSYLFSKSYCERPATRQRLKELGCQLAGQELDFRFSVDESAPRPAQKAATAPDPLPKRLRTSIVEGDSFVESAVSVFGGQVVEVRPIASEPIVPDGESDEEGTE